MGTKHNLLIVINNSYLLKTLHYNLVDGVDENQKIKAIDDVVKSVYFLVKAYLDKNNELPFFEHLLTDLIKKCGYDLASRNETHLFQYVVKIEIDRRFTAKIEHKIFDVGLLSLPDFGGENE